MLAVSHAKDNTARDSKSRSGILRSFVQESPGKPNQKRGRNEKFMNFTYFL